MADDRELHKRLLSYPARVFFTAAICAAVLLIILFSRRETAFRITPQAVVEDTRTIRENDFSAPIRIYQSPKGVQVVFYPERADEANCYAIIDTQAKQAAIIDPGRHNGKLMNEYLASRRITPAYVLITHAHRDHLGGLNYCLKHTDARVVAHPMEVERFPSSCRPGVSGGSVHDEHRFVFRVDEQEVECGTLRLKAILIPGHTVASLAYHLDRESIVFSGDTLFRGSIGRTDLPGNAGEACLVNHLKTRLMSLDEHTRVFPGHGGFTTIGQERATNQFVGDSTPESATAGPGE